MRARSSEAQPAATGGRLGARARAARERSEAASTPPGAGASAREGGAWCTRLPSGASGEATGTSLASASCLERQGRRETRRTDTRGLSKR